MGSADAGQTLKVSLPLPGGRRTSDWQFELSHCTKAGKGYCEMHGTGAEQGVGKATSYLVRVSHPGDLDAAVQQQFDDEASLLRHVDHLHIMKLFMQFEQDGATYTIFETTPGGSLESALTTTPPCAATVQRWFRELAGALAHLHSRQLAHLAVSPASVRLDGSGRVKLAGFCTQLDTKSVFCPPEMRGNAAQTRAGPEAAAADVYALGATLKAMTEAGSGTPLPQEMQTLLGTMLDEAWQRRPSASEVLKNVWVSSPVVGASTATFESGNIPSVWSCQDLTGSAPLSPLGPGEVDTRCKALSPAGCEFPGLALSPGTKQLMMQPL